MLTFPRFARRAGSTATLLVILGPSLGNHGLFTAIAATTLPAPIDIAPSQYWEGNDGPWSTFTLQVGTPAQNVRALISTANPATWIVLPEGCPATTTTIDSEDCASRRGGQFNINGSSTWEFEDYFELFLQSNLGYSGNGAFGFDRVGIDWQGSGGPILDHQVVAGIATSDFWLGSFGLNPRPTNFTDFNDPQPSFLQTLKNKSMIPSLSWSYTAGAPYRFGKVPGSLTFGGYDLSKSGPTNLTVAMNADIERDLTVGLQDITMSTSAGESIPLLPAPIYTFIDSTVPHIWLPVASCQAFERALNITWNTTVELYLLSTAQHENLIRQNATFTFRVSNTTTVSPPSLDITLPYASFDLVVDYPIVRQPTRYFPIRRAQNDTQYTLGRTFLQEAYLTADYERSIFHISPAVFAPSAKEYIIPITSLTTLSNSTSPNSPSRRPLSTPATIAISVIIPVIFLLVAGILMARLLKKRRERKAAAAAATASSLAYPADTKAELDAKDTTSPGEIGGTPIEYFGKSDVLHDGTIPEMGTLESGAAESRPVVYEMQGDVAERQELDGGHRGQELGDGREMR